MTEATEEAEAEGDLTDPERRERGTEDRREDGGEGRDQIEWEMVVELVQMTFRDGVLAAEANYQAVVLIPKKGGDHRGIGLMKVVWKAVVVILNCRFTASIKFHDSLY